jgi:SPP1 family predicted phage head-tail adaptor
MPFDASKLRHRVDIQGRLRIQDTETGAIVVKWKNVWTSVPAAIEPLSVRDFMASQAAQSEIVARITIRYRAGLSADMRIVHNAKNHIYTPAGWLPDPDSGLEYVTAPCSLGVSEGQ